MAVCTRTHRDFGSIPLAIGSTAIPTAMYSPMMSHRTVSREVLQVGRRVVTDFESIAWKRTFGPFPMSRLTFGSRVVRPPICGRRAECYGRLLCSAVRCASIKKTCEIGCWPDVRRRWNGKRRSTGTDRGDFRRETFEWRNKVVFWKVGVRFSGRFEVLHA